MSIAALAPRKPVKRDDVESRTRFRVRERIAFVRYWLHVHPAWRGFLICVVLFPTVEHYAVTFPAIGDALLGVFHVIGAAWSLLVDLFTPSAADAVQ